MRKKRREVCHRERGNAIISNIRWKVKSKIGTYTDGGIKSIKKSIKNAIMRARGIITTSSFGRGNVGTYLNVTP